jgi:DNA-binding transcriptional LysR family regulator
LNGGLQVNRDVAAGGDARQFSRGGAAAHTTQPAISQRIAQLECEMGVKLPSREYRMASPTPSGRQLMVYAEKLIGLRSEMMAEVGDRSATRGVMRLGVAETTVAVELVADLAGKIAQSSALVDAPALARH